LNHDEGSERDKKEKTKKPKQRTTSHPHSNLNPKYSLPE
jgi:hypothetical protein